MKKFKVFLSVSLIPFILIINNLNTENYFIENYYSKIFYIFVSEKIRFITHWINISVGDIIYLSVICYLFFFSITNIKNYKKYVTEMGSVAFIFIFIFYTFWGLNYKKVSLTSHLNLNGDYTNEKLIGFTKNLILNINSLQNNLVINDSFMPINPHDFSVSKIISENDIRKISGILGDSIIKSNYPYPSVKKSIFSIPLLYMGFSGYINPFTNEANINYKIPKNQIPLTISHEISHQLGIASERDANFIAYLSLINSNDEFHNYCGMSYALRLCLNEISKIDNDEYKKILNTVNKGIIKDFINSRNFWLKFDGLLEKISKKTYDKYLKQNNIESGIKNYNESISLILNYNSV